MSPPATRLMSRSTAAGLVTFVVMASAYAINYASLYEVAVAARIDPRLAYLYPVVIDGLGIAGYIAVDALAGGWRAYAWFMVGAAFAMSLAGGAAHSMTENGSLVLPALGRAAASAAAGFSAFGTVHLFLLILAGRRRDTVPEPLRRPAPVARPIAEPVSRTEPARAPVAEPARPTLVASPEPGSPEDDDRIVREMIRARERVTATTVQARIGKSLATAKRVLARVRAAEAAA